MKIIARIHSPFTEKFGIPRQSGLVKGTYSRIIFEPEYRVPEAFRGIEGYSHLWLIWQFSEAQREEWSPTVRPPRLGGNKRMGVFATRSPYRPNPIGLSSVRLIEVQDTKEFGKVLIVEGADLLDGTPIYDVKPYLAFTDSHPDATGGFADGVSGYSAEVDFPEELLVQVKACDREPLLCVLKQDPRPSYKGDSEREYGMKYGAYEVFFKAENGVLRVTNIKISK